MPTADADDWDAHWDSYAASTKSNPAQKYRRQLIADQLAASGPVRLLVDAGAGQGDLLRDLSRKFPRAELVGLEPSESGRRCIERDLPDVKVLDWNGLAELVPENIRGTASHMTCSEVLEHVDDPTTLLRSAVSALAPSGCAVVTVPGGPKTAFDRHIGHRQHFRADGLKTIMEAAGLSDVHVYRAGFPIFNIYKTVLLVRGKKLVDDVATGSTAASPGLVMKAFDKAFPASAPNSPFGWQLIGVGKNN